MGSNELIEYNQVLKYMSFNHQIGQWNMTGWLCKRREGSSEITPMPDVAHHTAGSLVRMVGHIMVVPKMLCDNTQDKLSLVA